MKIEKYASGQYAGTLDQDISFQPGMNVVLGDNEAGKSTMISGIMETLLMPAKLDKRSERGKGFILRRFPTNGTNYIDGEVLLTLGGEKISIRKEWDKNDPKESRTTLRYLNSGKKVTGATAEEEIKNLLQYGDAVFQKIIFGRQDNEDEILDWLFSFLGDKTDDGLAEAKKQVAGALAAAGGISEELFLAKLSDKLNELDGHWDFERDRPEKGRELNNRWLNGVGNILRAYYSWKEKEQDFEKGEEKIGQAVEAELKLCQQREEKQQLLEKKEALQNQQVAIQSADLLRQREASLAKELAELSVDKENWPKLLEEQMRLDGIIAEDTERSKRKEKEVLEQILNDVRECDTEISARLKAMRGKEEIEADAQAYRRLQNKLNSIEVKLSATKLTARVALQGEYRADVESADGQVAQGAQAFDEAAKGYIKVTIPGVGQVTVAPQDLDVDELKTEWEQKQAELREILERYDVETSQELEQTASAYKESKNALEKQESKKSILLAGRTVEEIAAALQQIETDPVIVIGNDLDQRIQDALTPCQETTLAGRKAVVDNQLKGLRDKYNHLSEIEKQQSGKSKELTDVKEKLEQIGEVSMTQKEYDRAINGIDAQMESLDGTLEDAIRRCATLAKESDEIDLEVLRAEQVDLEGQFVHQKHLYSRYFQIRQDFLRIQEGQEDQYSEFYALFNRYLSIATGDSLCISNGNVVISKKNELPEKEFLSTGTKKAILLAFRLALLNYYYPEESGVVVLDDILLDMDPDRRQGAAKLLSEFAKENQVIFTSCDPAIANLLGGNLIKL